jgi:uncharacterized repeat protein (TIGR02543 family)
MVALIALIAVLLVGSAVAATTLFFKLDTTVPGSVNYPTGTVYYTVTVVAGPNGSATGGGTYEAGSTVVITATPQSGYEFAGWTGDYVGSDTPHSIVGLAGNMTVTANFTAPAVANLYTNNTFTTVVTAIDFGTVYANTATRIVWFNLAEITSTTVAVGLIGLPSGATYTTLVDPSGQITITLENLPHGSYTFSVHATGNNYAP